MRLSDLLRDTATLDHVMPALLLCLLAYPLYLLLSRISQSATAAIVRMVRMQAGVPAMAEVDREWDAIIGEPQRIDSVDIERIGNDIRHRMDALGKVRNTLAKRVALLDRWVIRRSLQSVESEQVALRAYWYMSKLLLPGVEGRDSAAVNLATYAEKLHKLRGRRASEKYFERVVHVAARDEAEMIVYNVVLAAKNALPAKERHSLQAIVEADTDLSEGVRSELGALLEQ